MNVNMAAVNGASIHKLAITNAATNIFASITPLVVSNRSVNSIMIQNNSGNDWYLGFSNAVTVPGGLLPGIWIPKNGGQLALQVGGAVVQTYGIWIISTAAGPDEGVLMQAC